MRSFSGKSAMVSAPSAAVAKVISARGGARRRNVDMWRAAGAGVRKMENGGEEASPGGRCGEFPKIDRLVTWARRIERRQAGALGVGGLALGISDGEGLAMERDVGEQDLEPA